MLYLRTCQHRYVNMRGMRRACCSADAFSRIATASSRSFASRAAPRAALMSSITFWGNRSCMGSTQKESVRVPLCRDSIWIYNAVMQCCNRTGRVGYSHNP